jgi:drug/metabolite transporter (DMT)-like permease
VTWVGWTSTAFLVMFSTVLAYASWYWALNHGSVVRIAPIQFGQPVVSVFVAVLLLGEALTGTVAISTLMIIGGIVLASRGRRAPMVAEKQV